VALTEQERRSVQSACRHLSQTLGGHWEIADEDSLDDHNPNVPSPETLIRDGTRTAAVEVKRLSHAAFDQHGAYLTYLSRRLAPDSGGHFLLSPPDDFTLPIGQPLIRRLRSQIAQVGPKLSPGDRSSILYRRDSYVSLSREGGDGFIYCCHQYSGDEVTRVSPQLNGAFMLVDCDTYEHSFHTDLARASFAAALVDACERRVKDGAGPLTWDEEWGLTRLDDDDDPPSVEMLVGALIDVRESTTEAVTRMVDAAAQKFEGRRWADEHILVLDKADGIMIRDRILEAVRGIDPVELSSIDLILWLDDEDAERLWTSNRFGDWATP